jgi:hypothetical protein
MRGLKPAPGEQPLPTDIGPEARVAQTAPQTGMPQAFAMLAGDFSSVAQEVSKLADQATSVAGQKAGETAGLDPEFRPTHQLTIYGKAFDDAGLNVYETQANTRMLADMQDAYMRHQGDPAGLQAELAQKRAGWLDHSLPDVRSRLALSFDKQSFTLQREAVREQHSRMDAANKGAAETELLTSMRQVQQRAYSLGLDPQADGVLASDVDQLQQTLQRRGLNGAPLVDPTAAAKIVDHARTEVAQARIMGAFDRLPSTDAKEAFLKQFHDDFAEGKGAAGALGYDGFQAMQRRLIAEMRQQRFLDATATREVSDRVKAVHGMAEKGYALPQDEMASLDAAMASISNPKLQEAWARDKANIEWQRDARTQTPQELSAWIDAETNRLRADGGKPEEVHRLDLATKLLHNMHSGLKQNALGWAARVGYAQPQPLDFSDTGKLAASIQARMPQAEQIGAHFNQPAQYFTPDERRAIGTAIAQGGQQGLAVLGAIAQAGGDKAKAMIGEVVPKSAATAALGAHVAEVGVTPVAQDALNGLAMRKDKDARNLTPMPKQSEILEAARQELSTTMDRKEFMDSKAALIDLANAVYLQRAGSKAAQSFDAGVWRQGLRELIGQRDAPDGTTYGGIVNQGVWHKNPIVLPPSMKQSGWRDAIDMLTPEDLQAAGLGKPVGGDGKDIAIDRVRNATLAQVGDGRYMLATGGGALTPGTEAYVMRDDGKKPLILDFKKLAPILGARRPDLFLTK